MDLVPVQRVTAAQSVAEQIIGEMRRGRLQPGDQLPTERELMQQLGVGRSSVREGLQMLVTLNSSSCFVEPGRSFAILIQAAFFVRTCWVSSSPTRRQLS